MMLTCPMQPGRPVRVNRDDPLLVFTCVYSANDTNFCISLYSILLLVHANLGFSSIIAF